MAALAIVLFSGEIILLVFPLLAGATGGVLVATRTRNAVVSGSLLLLSASIGLLAVTRLQIGTMPLSWFHDALGVPYLVALGIATAAAVVATQWQDIHPPWIAIASATLLAVAVAATFISYQISPATFGTATTIEHLPAAALSLACITPTIILLRST